MADMPKDLSEIDAILIQYADVESAAAISFRIGGVLTPNQVMARIDHLVEVPDRLTMLQQDQLITLKMRRVIAQLEEWMSGNGARATTRTAEVLLGGLERIGNRLDKRQAATQSELSTLYAFQGVAMLEAINLTLDVMKHELTGTAADKIDPAAWDAALVKGMRAAQMRIASLEAGDSPVHDEEVEMPASVSGNSVASHAKKRELESRRDYVATDSGNASGVTALAVKDES